MIYTNQRPSILLHRFADRDMLMRYLFGLGVGHVYTLHAHRPHSRDSSGHSQEHHAQELNQEHSGNNSEHSLSGSSTDHYDSDSDHSNLDDSDDSEDFSSNGDDEEEERCAMEEMYGL